MINEGLLLRKLKNDFPGVSFKISIKEDGKHVDINNTHDFPIVVSDEIKKLGGNERDIGSLYYEEAKKIVQSLLSGKQTPVVKPITTAAVQPTAQKAIAIEVEKEEKKPIFGGKKKKK